MRALVSLFVAALCLVGSVAGALAQGTASPVPQTAFPAVDYIDESGNTAAIFTVTGIERDWQGYDQFYAPQPGNEYVRVTVMVESKVGRGAFSVDASSFILQDTDGFIAAGYPVPPSTPPANPDDFSMTGQAEIQSGAPVELVLTFEVLKGVELEALYFTPDYYSTRLLTLARFTP